MGQQSQNKREQSEVSFPELTLLCSSNAENYSLRTPQPTNNLRSLPFLLLCFPASSSRDKDWHEMFFSRMSQSERFVFRQRVESC